MGFLAIHLPRVGVSAGDANIILHGRDEPSQFFCYHCGYYRQPSRHGDGRLSKASTVYVLFVLANDSCHAMLCVAASGYSCCCHSRVRERLHYRWRELYGRNFHLRQLSISNWHMPSHQYASILTMQCTKY